MANIQSLYSTDPTEYSTEFPNTEFQTGVDQHPQGSLVRRTDDCYTKAAIQLEENTQLIKKMEIMLLQNSEQITEQAQQITELKQRGVERDRKFTKHISERDIEISELKKKFLEKERRINYSDSRQVSEQNQILSEDAQHIGANTQYRSVQDQRIQTFIKDEAYSKVLKIEQRAFIKENESMNKFYRVLCSQLSSSFSSTFVLAKGEVARNQKECMDRGVQAFGILGEIAPLIPPVRAIPGAGRIISTATRILTTVVQAILDQRKVKHSKSRIEIMLTIGEMEEESEKVARKLCEMYAWQLSKLTVEGSERLAIHAITEILTFMLYGDLRSTQPFHRQWIQVLQERKRTYWDELKNSITHLGSSSCFEFFDIYTDELSTVDDIKETWIGLDPFSRCGIRLKVGAYFIGEVTQHERYGYRIGGQEDIRDMRQEEVLKELSYIPTFPQLEDIQAEKFESRRLRLEYHQEEESLVVHEPSGIQSIWKASMHTVKRDFASARTYLVFKMVIDLRDETVVAYVSREGCIALGSRVTIIKDMEAEFLYRKEMSIENEGDSIIRGTSKVERIYARVRLEAYNPLAYPIAYNTFGRDSRLALDEKMFRIVTPRLQNAYKEDTALLKEIFLFAEKYRDDFITYDFLDFTRRCVHGGMVTVLDRRIKENEDEIFSHRLIGFNPISLVFAPVLGPLLLHWESTRKEDYKSLIMYLQVISMAQKGLNAFGRILGVRNWGERNGFKTDFFYNMEKYTLSDDLLVARDQVVNRFFRTLLQGISYKSIRPHNSQTWAIDKLNSEI